MSTRVDSSRLSGAAARSGGGSPLKSARRSRLSDAAVCDSATSSRRTTAAGDERVKVFVRVRPTKTENETTGALKIKAESNGLVIYRDHATVASNEFEFDRVLPPTASQSDVYQAAVKPIVEDVLNGYNGTVMAYGQTGAGKTYTLSSIQPSAIGMIPRALAEVFSAVAADSGHEYTVLMSYIQIYMELIQDLLRPESENLQIRESEGGDVFVGGVCQKEVCSIEQCLALLQQGDRNRTTAFTALNASSSRSHAVLMLTVIKRKHVAGTGGAEIARVKVGRLFMVDLAGSERLKKSKSIGLRATEAKSINLSLTTLGMCINARADPNSTHVPFRDSKLTRLLQDSLGGNAKTSLIVACCDAAEHVDETLQSLQFGSRAMFVRTAAVINETVDYRSQDAEVIAALDQKSALLERTLLAKEAELEAAQAQLQAEHTESLRIIEVLRREREEVAAAREQAAREQAARLEAEQRLKAELEAQLQESSQRVQGIAEQHERERDELLAALRACQAQLEEAHQAAEAAEAAHQQQVAALQQTFGEQRLQLVRQKEEEQQQLAAECKAQVASVNEELGLVQRQLLGSREEVRILQSAHEQAMHESQASWEARLQQTEASWAAKVQQAEAEAERKLAEAQADVAARDSAIQQLHAVARSKEDDIERLQQAVSDVEEARDGLSAKLAAAQEHVAALQQRGQRLESQLAVEHERIASYQSQVDAYERSRLNLAQSFFEHKRVSDAARTIQRHYREHRMRRMRRQQSEGYAALSQAKSMLGSLAQQHAELEKRRAANLAFSGQTLVGDGLGVLQDAVEAIVAAFVLPARDLRGVQRYNQKVAGSAAALPSGSLSARSSCSTHGGGGGGAGPLPPSLLQRTSGNPELIRAVRAPNPLGQQSVAVSQLQLGLLQQASDAPKVLPLALPPPQQQLQQGGAAAERPGGLAGFAGRAMSFSGRSPFRRFMSSANG